MLPGCSLLSPLGNVLTDNEFVFEDGLQDMSGVNGYASWVSLPHFLYSAPDIHSRYNMTPEEERHLPNVRTVEPWN